MQVPVLIYFIHILMAIFGSFAQSCMAFNDFPLQTRKHGVIGIRESAKSQCPVCEIKDCTDSA